MSLFAKKKLFLATHNAGKIKEISDMVKLHGLEIITAADMNLDEPEETGVTFAENAALKALAAAQATGIPALADDSGFCTEALYGGPGIYSARFAKAHGGWEGGMKAVLDAAALSGAKTAWFVTVLCLAFPNRKIHFFEGIVKGSLAQSMRGANGFGYDPIFIPNGHNRTFGEMNPTEKNSFSHRRIALDKFVQEFLDDQPSTA